jgi:hypothetical protein
MVLWRKRFHREYGESARYVWKLEFQRRGAPHVHLWMAPRSRGRSGQPFRVWLSHAWTDVVAHPDPSERARHLLAGTAADVLNGLRACDPKRLAIYFTKHSSPNTLGDKEYQHIIPGPWREPGKGPGRFWGVFGLKRATATYGNTLSRYPTQIDPVSATNAARAKPATPSHDSAPCVRRTDGASAAAFLVSNGTRNMALTP